MKLIVIALFVGFFGFAQEVPKITKEGFAPVVVNLEGKTASEIYLKTKEWVQTYYKNPAQVLKADIANDMIRIQGFAVNGYKIRSLGISQGYDYDYTLEIEFKDGKYRYNYIVGQFWADTKRCLYDYKSFFKDDNSVRKLYQLPYDTINATANETSLSLFDYVSGKTKSEKKDW